ncbi:hypothetical protein TL16_g09283 [Triparma laevis f. inornata]|uniref:BTB domain-containing protein n=2 Tax=Triparma laevis TaxID=1534972 RepID=A0A9W7AQK8_9STRA|nr:hypothetical protein TrLO_g14922 [Triparma laevis f. longispina]GMH82513.1 hypothetical protein TL16_g09283 [Triparma laevis f. inornata]
MDRSSIPDGFSGLKSAPDTSNITVSHPNSCSHHGRNNEVMDRNTIGSTTNNTSSPPPTSGNVTDDGISQLHTTGFKSLHRNIGINNPLPLNPNRGTFTWNISGIKSLSSNLRSERFELCGGVFSLEYFPREMLHPRYAYGDSFLKEFAEGDCGVRVDLIVWGEEEGLGEELGRGFEGGEYCDCLLFCEEERESLFEDNKPIIKAHKFILSSRSKYFSELFKKDLSNKYNLPFKISILKPIIQYLYTSKIPEFSGDLLLTHECCEMIGVEKLKGKVEEGIGRGLTPGNVVGRLLWADGGGGRVKVREGCLRFIGERAGEVMEGEGWRVLVDKAPDLIAELFANATGASARKRQRSNSEEFR